MVIGHNLSMMKLSAEYYRCLMSSQPSLKQWQQENSCHLAMLQDQMQFLQRSTKQDVLQLQRNWQSYFTLCGEKKQSLKNSRMQQLSTYSKGKGILKSVTIIEASLYCQILGISLLESYWIDWMNTLNSQGFYQKVSVKDGGTIDMIFTARQLQEKCQEQTVDLYMTFVDLTKAFDTVSLEEFWKIMANS